MQLTQTTNNYPYFGARHSRPVLIFDIDNTYQRYNSAKDAGEAIYASKNTVVCCARGYSESVADKVSIYADIIEIDGKRGAFKPDIYAGVQKSLDKIREKQAFLLNDGGIIVDKFPTNTLAADTLGLPRSTFVTSLKVNSVLTKNGLIPASFKDIFSKNKKGDIYLDEKKVDEVLSRALNSKSALYLVDRAKNSTRYKNPEQASKLSGIGNSAIRYNQKHGLVIDEKYVVIPALGNETRKPGEKYHLKPEALDKAMEIFNTPGKYAIPVYSIDENFNYTRYSSLTKAAQAVSTSCANILSCLDPNTNNVSIKGNFYCLASLVETYLEDGSIFVDEDKLREVYEYGMKKYRPHHNL